MGIVYRAHDTRLELASALEVFPARVQVATRPSCVREGLLAGRHFRLKPARLGILIDSLVSGL